MDRGTRVNHKNRRTWPEAREKSGQHLPGGGGHRTHKPQIKEASIRDPAVAAERLRHGAVFADFVTNKNKEYLPTRRSPPRRLRLAAVQAVLLYHTDVTTVMFSTNVTSGMSLPSGTQLSLLYDLQLFGTAAPSSPLPIAFLSSVVMKTDHQQNSRRQQSYLFMTEEHPLLPGNYLGSGVVGPEFLEVFGKCFDPAK